MIRLFQVELLLDQSYRIVLVINIGSESILIFFPWDFMHNMENKLLNWSNLSCVLKNLIGLVGIKRTWLKSISMCDTFISKFSMTVSFYEKYDWFVGTLVQVKPLEWF